MNPFLQYITRPSGVGRTKWLPFIFIRLGAGAAIYYGITMLANEEPWGWLVLAFGPGLLIGFYYGTRSNYRTDKAREEAGSSNKHRADVCETCNPVRWKDGRPLTELHQWYAAVHDLSWDDSEVIIDRMHQVTYRHTKDDHDKYMRHPQFRKFKTT
jgi:hypothetical protein